MKIDQKFVSSLKNFATINPSILFVKGSVLKTISPSRSIIARAKINQTIEREFGIYETSKFLSVLSLFDDPDIEVDETCVIISDKNKRMVRYVVSDPETVLVDKNLKLMRSPRDATELRDNEDVVDRFTLESSVIASMMKAIGVLGTPVFGVIGDGKFVKLCAMNPKNPTSDVYSATIGESEKTFEAHFTPENIKLLPYDYEMILTKTHGLFHHEEAGYRIALEATSKMG